MLPQNTWLLVDDLVRCCHATSDPIPGIFWLAEALPMANKDQVKTLSRAMRSLVALALRKPGSCLCLHNLQTMQAQALAMNLPALQRSLESIETQSPAPHRFYTGLACLEWSVLGLLCYRQDITALAQCLKGIEELAPTLFSSLRDPQAMPIHEEFLQPQRFFQPLGQWIPAYPTYRKAPSKCAGAKRPESKTTHLRGDIRQRLQLISSVSEDHV